MRTPLRVSLAACLLLGACALGPDFHPPEAPAGDAVVPAAHRAAALEADGAGQRFDRQADLPADWWKRFGSPEVDRMVASALAHSPSLRAAQATLRQSEDQWRAGYGAFFPQVGASVSAAREVTLANLPAPFGHGLTPIGPYDLGTFSGSVSFVPDLFGAQRRTVEALGAAAQSQAWNLRSSYLGLTAGVVDAEIARAAYAAQREATVRIVATLDDQIRLAKVQYQAGTSTYAAVLALQSQRAADAAAAAALDQREEQSEHLLADLCGAAPAGFEAPREALEAFKLPPELPDALPASLARHRPDILAAEAQLHVASAQIGVATADLFPSLTLGGAGGASQSVISRTLKAGTRFWSVQANLAGSLFNGGSQWYERKAAIDAYDAALAQYETVVLAALEQVADDMRALDHDAQALQAQSESLAAATEGLRLTQAGYGAGTAGYLDLLNADAQLQQARVSYLAAKAQRLQDTVALYAALGGGWWNATPATAANEAAR